MKDVINDQTVKVTSLTLSRVAHAMRATLICLHDRLSKTGVAGLTKKEHDAGAMLFAGLGELGVSFEASQTLVKTEVPKADNPKAEKPKKTKAEKPNVSMPKLELAKRKRKRKPYVSIRSECDAKAPDGYLAIDVLAEKFGYTRSKVFFWAKRLEDTIKIRKFIYARLSSFETAIKNFEKSKTHAA